MNPKLQKLFAKFNWSPRIYSQNVKAVYLYKIKLNIDISIDYDDECTVMVVTILLTKTLLNEVEKVFFNAFKYVYKDGYHVYIVKHYSISSFQESGNRKPWNLLKCIWVLGLTITENNESKRSK